MINGSPKIKSSASKYILQELKPLLPIASEVLEYHFKTYKLNSADLNRIAECNVLVFLFPLYVDGVPSHLVNCLYEIETFIKTKPTINMTVYSIVNCGFYEGHQGEIALDIMKNWCEKVKFTWGQGIGIGGGGMLPMLAGVPDEKGPKKNISKALKIVANSISTGIKADNIFISPNFPRFAYKIGAEIGWRKQAKANGLKPKDLFMKM